MSMFDKKPVQLEIFSSGHSSSEAKAERNVFVKRLWGFEKIILIFIGFILVGIISFSLGMERGRNSSLSGPQASLVSNNPPQAEPVNVKTYPSEKDVLSGYTIQVASFKNNTSAQKEADLLKKKGFKSVVLVKSGDYILVCVGNFPSKEKAKLSLRELKKAYKDCILRRL